MFGKLKEKLKSALSIFSRKTEEEAEEKVIPVQKAVEEKEKTKKEYLAKGKTKEIKLSEKVATSESIPANEVRIAYFVHGTTTDNEQDKATGWNQGELSAMGKRQSLELKDKIKSKRFEGVFSSDLQRAVESAKLTFGKTFIQDKRLRECNYGDWNGADAAKVKSAMFQHINTPFSNGESYKDVEKRMAEFLNSLYEQYKGKRVALVAHQAPQLALDVLLKGKRWDQAIQEDWRLLKKWQPGWDYVLSGKISIKERKQTMPEPEAIKEEKHLSPEKKRERATEPEIPEEPKKSFFGRIKEAITTKTISAEKFDELFWDLEVALLENNVSVKVIEKIKEDLKQELVEKPLPRDVEKKIRETLQHTLREIVSFEKIDFIKTIRSKKPFIIAFFGINGSGKTTSIAKLAHYLQQKQFSVVLAAGDTFRAAAIQQLEEHAHKLGVKMIKHDYGSDAAAVAFDAVKYAEKNKVDVVLIDTAGRLHSNTNLMAELEKIIRVTKPDLKIFVGESITGNDCIEQARQFNEAVNLDGCILTKADVDEKGGAPLSIAYTIRKPIFFLGVGQKYSDLQEFNPDVIVGQLGL